MSRPVKVLIILMTLVALFFTGCSRGRTYQGTLKQDIGTTNTCYLLIRDDGSAQIHISGESDKVDGTYTRDGENLKMKFASPNSRDEYLTLDVKEVLTEKGWTVSGRFHFDFGGKKGIDGEVKLKEYKG